MNRKHLFILLAAACLLAIMAPALAIGQTASRYDICEIQIDTVKTEKGGFLFWRDYKTIDLQISWGLMDLENGTMVDPEILSYKVYCSENRNMGQAQVTPVTSGNSAIFLGKEAYKQYYIVIEALDRTTGQEISEKKAEYSFPSSKRIDGRQDPSSISVIRENFKDAFSDELGAIIISFIFLIALFAMLFIYNSWRTLKSKRFFPTIAEIHNDDTLKEISKTIGFDPDSNTLGMDRRFLETFVSREQFYGDKFNKLTKTMHLQKDFPKRKGELVITEILGLRILNEGIKAVKKNNGDAAYRKMEDQIESEMINLRKRSFVEWLWNMGFTQPLLGLFGTVIGLTLAFMKYGKYGAGAIQEFAPQVAVALTTTILGLFFGVIIMMIHYHYNYKLDRIEATWYRMASEVAKKL